MNNRTHEAVKDTTPPALIHNQLLHHVPGPGQQGEERSDWFWHRRAWPNRTIAPSAYPTALAEAARMPILSQGVGKFGALSSFVWQPIGPYSIDGRITSIAVDPTDSNIFYVGAATGGLWKTVDHGVSWVCVTDTFGSLPVGCVTIDPQQPQTVYLGMGECNGSADSYPGDGLWKSTDGGNTWSYLGFASAQFIAKIVIDPHNDQRIFLAVPGPSNNADTNRGIYRSTDAGATWQRVLSGGVQTLSGLTFRAGFIDLAIDPLNSADLVAAAYDHSLTVSAAFYPGGNGGTNTGIYRSIDSGTTWNRIDTIATSGLPNGETWRVLGRIALLWTSGGGVNPSKDYLFAGYIRADTNPLVHQMIDENFEGLYRSADEGITWTKILDSTIRIPMGGVLGKDSANLTNAQGGYDFYLAAGPVPADGNPTIYLGGIDISRSTDLGMSWKDITNSYSEYYVKGNREQHSDQHGLAFAGTDMLAVSDGGVYETRDTGARWRQLPGLPITQFYAIEPWRGEMARLPNTISAADLKVFGGTQDNGTVGNLLSGTSFAWINHGDGETAIAHPTDSNKLISSLEYGVIFARNTLDSLVPLPLDMKDTTHDTRPRWHTITYRLLDAPHPLTDTQEAVAWNAPMVLDDENPTALYTGRCHVYKATLDWNDLENTTWQLWSPQLAGYSGNDGVWGYGDIETLALGPHDPAGRPMIWVGGYSKLYRTQADLLPDDTAAPHWILAESGVPSGVVSAIVPDRSDSLTAFCAMATASNVAHVLKTTNGGKRWVNISGNLPSAPVSALVIDTLAEHGNPALKNQALIVGTDVGVFASMNGGVTWEQLGTGMPHIIVADLKIYKNMLIAATHGRSLYAMDISTLQAEPASVAELSASSGMSISIYPNPVVGGASFSISMAGAPKDQSITSCRLIDESSGRVFLATLKVDGGAYRVLDNPQVPTGSYLVELLHGEERLSEGHVTIMR